MRRLLRRLGIYLAGRSGPPSRSISSCRVWRRATPPRSSSTGSRSAAPSIQRPSRRWKLEFGVNTTDPLWVQYLNYLNNLLHGNLGVSTTYFPNTVSDIIGQDIRWTLVLLTVSVLLSFTLGTLIGIFMAWRRGSCARYGRSRRVMTFFYSILYPWLALIAVYFLGYTLGWFPFSDGYDLSTHARLEPRLSPERRLPRHPARADHHHLDHRRLDADDAQFDDYHPLRGLRPDGAGEGAELAARDVRLRGAQRHPAERDGPSPSPSARSSAASCWSRSSSRIPASASRSFRPSRAKTTPWPTAFCCWSSWPPSS